MVTLKVTIYELIILFTMARHSVAYIEDINAPAWLVLINAMCSLLILRGLYRQVRDRDKAVL